MPTTTRWIVTADSRCATLFSCQLRPGASPHVEERGRINNPHEAEHERQRPSLLGGAERRGALGCSGAAAAPHCVAQGHTTEEEDRRFAREVAAWLDGMNARLTVFAPPRFLGLLRKEVRARPNAPDLRDGELCHLGAGELADHATVRELLGVPPD